MVSIKDNVYQYLLPNLLEIQRASFCWFLEKGLVQEFEDFSLIRDYLGELELNLSTKFYKIKRPKYTLEESKRRDTTYSVAIYITAHLKKQRLETSTAEVFLGDIPLMTNEDEVALEKENLPDVLPILPLTNTVLFPGVVIPINAGRDKSIKLIKDANKSSKLIGVVAQRNINDENPGIENIYGVGTVAKILRVLTDQKFKRNNGNNDIVVDVRLICSSSKDLKKEIEIGNFREDLFHRINVFEINIEPLNQRISDIPLLIKYFSKKISENYKIKELDIDENNSYILNHNWHGNVRELRNLIERIAILQPDTKDKISNIIKESLKNTNFDDQLAENSLSVPLKEAREKFEKEYLTIQLKKFNGNISKTANFVGMERSALHRKLKGLGIKEFN